MWPTNNLMQEFDFWLPVRMRNRPLRINSLRPLHVPHDIDDPIGVVMVTTCDNRLPMLSEEVILLRADAASWATLKSCFESSSRIRVMSP